MSDTGEYVYRVCGVGPHAPQTIDGVTVTVGQTWTFRVPVPGEPRGRTWRQKQKRRKFRKQERARNPRGHWLWMPFIRYRVECSDEKEYGTVTLHAVGERYR